MQDQISAYLWAYRKCFNAQYALLSMLEKWGISLGKGGYDRGFLLDLSKPFDAINHDLLVAKLYAYGFNKNALRLVESYLFDRSMAKNKNELFF